MHRLDELAATGNPADFVISARKILQEAVRLSLRVKWHVGRSVINHLSTRHSLFARDLGPMALSCPDPDDSADQFDALLTKIHDTNQEIIRVNGETWWVQTNIRAHDTTTYNPGHSSEVCHYGENCRNKDNGKCNRIHKTARKGKAGKGNSKGKGKGKGKSNKFDKANKPDTKKDNSGICVAKDCMNDQSPHGDLCPGCWKQAKADGGYQNRWNKRVPVKTSNKPNKKATANAAAAEDEQLAITDGQQRPRLVSIPLEEYQSYLESLKSQVNDDKNNRANTLSVIGEELLRH